ncbi:uncharacterized protein [Arachis hypogaea]|uniref:uncharacterized protein n=1 Tax=Arachis hypogaea TaxID=3818 RepID=UPI000DECD393|nr:uncharacterized protein LOC112728309 [Arachis hypogaea]
MTQNKDEVVLSVKDYSICRGVEYRVLESDHLKYHEKCKDFGKGCSWLIPNLLRARKGTWEVDESTVYFHRLFWTFSPCIEPFRHCKPLVSIDGTHLYGKYGGTLLLAIAQDGNSNILPIAFALVEGENAETWSFFLSNLLSHVTPKEDINVISDRHNDIKAALDAPENAANFSLSFKAKDARRMLVNAAYAKTEAEFYYWFDIMQIENPTMCDWANRMEYDKWTQHEDSGRRFGHMTINISECVNSVLKKTRNLLVISLVKSTYGRLAELFMLRGQTA